MNKSYDVYMCRLDKRKETERQLADAELLRSIAHYPIYAPPLSPFDRMPSKIEMDGMMEIFKREYGGDFSNEK